MQPPLRSLLNQSVVIEHYNGMDEYTEYPSYQPPITLPAYVENRARMIRTATGESVNASTTVVLDDDAQIDLMDRMTLPDGSQPPILQRYVARDDKGRPHHTRVWL